MTKIPVQQTIAEAYRFTFAGLGNVIGLIWLPIVLLTVGRYFVAADAAISDPENVNLQGPVIVRGLAFDLIAVLLFAVMAVAIARDILKPRQRPALLRFSLGLEEFRVAGGYVGLFFLMVVFVIGLFLAAMVAAAAGKIAGGSVIAGALAGAVVLAGLGALVFVLVRLSFLLVPGAALEGGFGLETSWKLTRGNFWRIVVIDVATLLPVTVVALIAALVVLGPDIAQLKFTLASDPVERARQMAALMRVILSHQPVLLGISFVLAPFTYGLSMSPPAFAYRALTGAAAK